MNTWFAGLLTAFVIAPGIGFAASPFNVTPRDPHHIRLIAYGDQRFTDVAEKDASRPLARQALVRRIAEEAADAVLMTGDVPWHGGTVNDYSVYQQETALWREKHLEIFPALGNHEFAGCAEAECLTHWWDANPRLSGLRWYSVAFGETVRAIALDSARPLTFGSEQRRWLENEIATLSDNTQYVVIFLHHPPVAAR
jgi:predicted MPP superfamily phosphohydrolase